MLLKPGRAIRGGSSKHLEPGPLQNIKYIQLNQLRILIISLISGGSRGAPPLDNFSGIHLNLRAGEPENGLGPHLKQVWMRRPDAPLLADRGGDLPARTLINVYYLF